MREVRKKFKEDAHLAGDEAYSFTYSMYNSFFFTPLVRGSRYDGERLDHPSYRTQLVLTDLMLGNISSFFGKQNYSDDMYTFYKKNIDNIILKEDIMKVNEEVIVAGINEISTDLELSFKNKANSGRIKIKKQVKDIYEKGLKEIIKAFGNNFGPNYIEKIYRMIVTNGIDDMIKFIEKKIGVQYDQITGLLKTPSNMPSTMKNIINILLKNSNII